MSREDVRSWTKAMGSQQNKPAPIIFTSGAFDILHPGHISYLHDAAHIEGDQKAPCSLVVGVNSDASIRQYKPSRVVRRPFNGLQYRMACIAALGCVDFVFSFDEPNNATNIEILRPKYYVKGGDYTKSDLASAPTVEAYGGQVVIIPIKEDYSTTRIMERMLNEARNLREGNA